MDSALTFLLLTLLFACASASAIPGLAADPAVEHLGNVMQDAASSIAKTTDDIIGATVGALLNQAFLAAHNKFRIKAGEPPLTWDPTLAEYARNYAEQRSGDCLLQHSNGPYGENIFWGTGKDWKPKDVVKPWMEEKQYYNRKTMECEEGKMCGHYTQVLWRDTERVGCAMVVCNKDNTYAVCSYDPPGNYVGEDPFTAHIEAEGK